MAAIALVALGMGDVVCYIMFFSSIVVVSKMLIRREAASRDSHVQWDVMRSGDKIPVLPERAEANKISPNSTRHSSSFLSSHPPPLSLLLPFPFKKNG